MWLGSVVGRRPTIGTACANRQCAAARSSEQRAPIGSTQNLQLYVQSLNLFVCIYNWYTQYIHISFSRMCVPIVSSWYTHCVPISSTMIQYKLASNEFIFKSSFRRFELVKKIHKNMLSKLVKIFNNVLLYIVSSRLLYQTI